MLMVKVPKSNWVAKTEEQALRKHRKTMKKGVGRGGIGDRRWVADSVVPRKQ